MVIISGVPIFRIFTVTLRSYADLNDYYYVFLWALKPSMEFIVYIFVCYRHLYAFIFNIQGTQLMFSVFMAHSFFLFASFIFKVNSLYHFKLTCRTVQVEQLLYLLLALMLL